MVRYDTSSQVYTPGGDNKVVIRPADRPGGLVVPSNATKNWCWSSWVVVLSLFAESAY